MIFSRWRLKMKIFQRYLGKRLRSLPDPHPSSLIMAVGSLAVEEKKVTFSLMAWLFKKKSGFPYELSIFVNVCQNSHMFISLFILSWFYIYFVDPLKGCFILSTLVYSSFSLFCFIFQYCLFLALKQYSFATIFNLLGQ